MDFLNSVYPQQSIANVLKTNGISMDGTIVMPWAGDQLLLLDANQNAIGYVSNNLMGGITISDQHMNIQGLSAASPLGGESIMNASYNQQAFTADSAAGGELLYTNDFQLESMTFESPTGETAYYSSDMELLGVSGPVAQGVQYNFSGGNLDPSSLPELTSYASQVVFQGAGDAAAVFTGGDLIVDMDLDYISEGLGIFDWL
ncbi:hypothetical protein [Planococcus shixiaomingii]|uniref:hypothetical protein n=1 Tax=Planococcus shixiaomingii TaxID=3058393 RepID=UPI002622CC67|nr:hypothetical protein [Planococcus sp. N022]WKA53954.1 hypothetical protein QWY21_14970 [Planococcus sp. N022]